VPPFPFQSPAVFSEDGAYLLMLNSSGQYVELFNTETNQGILRIEKKGDYNIKTCSISHQDNIVYMAYTDCKDTSIFAFDAINLSLKKLTPSICLKNSVASLPPASRLFFSGKNLSLLTY
jgi:WD40 repeat protein